MSAGTLAGNAAADNVGRGWFVGHFVTDKADPRSTEDVEAKWGVHKAGDEKPTWAQNLEATTLSILVRGKFRIRFPSNDVLLSKEGDYVIWEPGVPHHWVAEEDSVVLTVRWPSRSGDVNEVEPGAIANE